MNPEPSTLLNRAASEGDFEDLCELISLYQFDTSSINQSLHSAVKKSQSTSDHLRCIEYLLNHSGNPNYKDASGISLLMTAARLGQIQLAELLVSYGSAVDDRDKDMRTALIYAVESGYGDNVDVVKFLLEKKAKVAVIDVHGNTALHKAVEMGYLNSIEVLIEYGAPINAENKEKNTPLHIAAKNRFELGIELLVKKKANCKVVNAEGKTPVELAPESMKTCFQPPESNFADFGNFINYGNSANSSGLYNQEKTDESLCKLCKKILMVGICKPCYEFNLNYSNLAISENRKIIEEYAKEINELKSANQDLNKKFKELTESSNLLKKSCQEKDLELKKKDSQLAQLGNDFKAELESAKSISKFYQEKAEEGQKEIESLQEQLLNLKNDLRLNQNYCETLRSRLEGMTKSESESPSKSKIKKNSYLKSLPLSPCNPTSILKEEAQAFLIEIDKWQEEVESAYSEITNTIKSIIKSKYPAANIEIYGSFASKLHLPSSDIDMVLHNIDGEKREVLRNIDKILRDQVFIVSCNYIQTAFVPVIKIKSELLGKQVQIDITVNDQNHSGLKCLELVNRLLNQSPLIRPVFLILKHLLSICNFKEPYNGGLGSYSLFLMVASFIQKQNELGKTRDVAESLKGFLEFYLNKEVYLAPIVTKDPLMSNNNYKPEVFGDYMSLMVVDPLNYMNIVSFNSNLYKLIDIFTIADYNLKKKPICECPSCASPLFRMIQEAGEYFGVRDR